MASIISRGTNCWDVASAEQTGLLIDGRNNYRAFYQAARAACLAADSQEVPTYIHSKLFLVDDRFSSVGSANLNNRSMGLDTEVNVAWEAVPEEHAMIESIRGVRVDLLAGHTGAIDSASLAELTARKGPVDYLERLAGSGSSRLRRHPCLDVNPAEYESLSSMLPDGFPFDMEQPESENVS